MAGAVVFNNYHLLHKGSWCEISVAIDDAECVSRRGLRQIFEYPFKQLGVSSFAGGNGGNEPALQGRSSSAWVSSLRASARQGTRWRDGPSGLLDASGWSAAG